MVKPYYASVSEVITSIEVIERSFILFKRNYKTVRKNEEDYYYLFWKQLRTDFRGFLRNSAPEIATRIDNKYYTDQVNDIHAKFRNYFEPIL